MRVILPGCIVISVGCIPKASGKPNRQVHWPICMSIDRHLGRVLDAIIIINWWTLLPSCFVTLCRNESYTRKSAIETKRNVCMWFSGSLSLYFPLQLRSVLAGRSSSVFQFMKANWFWHRPLLEIMGDERYRLMCAKRTWLDQSPSFRVGSGNKTSI